MQTVGHPRRPEMAFAQLSEIMLLARSCGVIRDLRTKLDEWAAFRVGGELLTCGGKQRWFNKPCPWSQHERLRTYMDWITPAADEVLTRGSRRDPAVRAPKKGEPETFRLIVDHAVPIKVLGLCILEKSSLWDEGQLEAFLLANFRRGVLLKSEDDVLNKARNTNNQSLKDSMPAGWRDGSDPFARYRAVGFPQLCGQEISTDPSPTTHPAL